MTAFIEGFCEKTLEKKLRESKILLSLRTSNIIKHNSNTAQYYAFILQKFDFKTYGIFSIFLHYLIAKICLTLYTKQRVI